MLVFLPHCLRSAAAALTLACGLAISLGFATAPAADAATTLVDLDLVANDLAVDHATGNVIATAGSGAGSTYGNRLIKIDGVTAQVLGSVFVGSEPTQVAVAHDGSRAFVGLNGANAIREVALPSLTPDLQVALPIQRYGSIYAEDIEVSPDDPTLAVVSVARRGISPRHDGVYAFTNNTFLPDKTRDHTGRNRVAFGSDGLLYGYNNETTGFGFYQDQITPTGITPLDSVGGVLSGFGVDFTTARNAPVGLSTTGKVIDLPSLTLLGSIATTGSVALNDDASQAFVLTSGGAIHIYEMATFLRSGVISTGLTGVTDLNYLGGNRLAFRNASRVFVLADDRILVPEPTVAALLALGLTLSLTRRRTAA